MITKFLLPRLPRFAALHPDIPISIETEIALNPMAHDGPDLSIRVTRTPPRDVLARLLFEECLLPVASPDLIAAKGLRKPEDLLSVTLLPGGGLPMFEGAPGWAEWFDAAGIPHPEIHSAMRFERNAADYPVDMAIAGSGVMLCRASLCHTALQSGQLICPFGPVLRTDVGVYLLARHDRKSEPHVRAFIDWMQAEAGLLRTLPSLHGGH